MPFPHTCYQPCPWPFDVLCMGLFYCPLIPTNIAPQIPSAALQPTNAFLELGGQCSSKRSPCLSLNICTDNTLSYQVSSYKMLVSPSRLTRGHHPSLALSEFSQVYISHQWRFCRNQLLFKFERVFNFNWEQTSNEYLLYSGQDMPSLINKYYVAIKIIQRRPIRGNMHAKLW